jgi:hypothetical protein
MAKRNVVTVAARQMYIEMMMGAYQEGAYFSCQSCKYSFRVDTDMLDEYIKYGWPRHHGVLMQISLPEDD